MSIQYISKALIIVSSNKVLPKTILKVLKFEWSHFLENAIFAGVLQEMEEDHIHANAIAATPGVLGICALKITRSKGKPKIGKKKSERQNEKTKAKEEKKGWLKRGLQQSS